MSQAIPSARLPLGTAAISQRLLRFDEPAGHLLRQVLEAQCRLSGARAAAVVRVEPQPEDRQQVQVLSCWPEGSVNGSLPAWLSHVARQLPQPVDQQAAMLVPLLRRDGLYGQGPSGYCVLAPLMGEETIEAWAIFELDTSDPAAAQAARQTLELTSPMLALYQSQAEHRQGQEGAKLLSVAVSVLSATGEHERAQAAGMALCNEIASRWHARRVSLGIQRGRYVKLQAMSRTEHLDRKTKLVQAVESAMEECLDQDTEVTWPPSAEASCVAQATRRLSDEFGSHQVLSLPVRRQGQPQAVLTIELEPGQPLTAEAVKALRLTVNLASPLLLKLDESDRWAGAKAATGSRRLLAKAVGHEHTWVKLTALGLLTGLLFVLLVQGPHRVSSPFLVQASQRQLVTAPFEGYLERVDVEPGDAVAADQTVLATLKATPLRLELASLLAQQREHETQRDLARRENEIAQARMAQAKAEAVAAQAALIQHRIEQATLRSPMMGVVLEGDHKREVGAAVEQGQVLFEVAPLEGLRAELRVPEDRAAYLAPGQRGQLAAAAHPGLYVPFTVRHIEPMAQVLEGQNVFRVWVDLDEVPAWLRPGMEGVAKIDVGRATYGWLWTHEAVEWLRMKLWL